MKASVILELVNKFSRPSKQVRGDLGLIGKSTSEVTEKLNRLKAARPDQVFDKMSGSATKASRATERLAGKEQAIQRIKQQQITQNQRLNRLAHARAVAARRAAAAEQLAAEKQIKAIERVKRAKEGMAKYGKAGAVVGASGAASVYAGKRALGGMFNMTNSIRPEEKARGELATMGIQDMDVIVSKARVMQGKVAGITSDVFLTAAYDIKSGISTLTDEGVAAQTASAGYVAKATKANIIQMTSLFATGYGIYKQQFSKLNDSQFGERFGASLVGAVQKFKSDGSKMQQSIESAGSDATLLGQKMSETFTILGMLQKQMQAGDAGTALRSFAENSGNAHEKFSKFAKTTTNPVTVRILDKNNMLREMPDILKDLRSRYGDTLDAMESREIASAFGSSEAVKTIKSLWGQEAALRANTLQMEKLGNAGDKYSQSVATLAGKNWDDKLILRQQKIALLRLELSEKLIPTMTKLLPYIDKMIDRVSLWINEHPELVKNIGMTVAALSTISIVGGALLLTIAPLLLGMGAMRLGFAMLGLKGGLLANVLRGLWAVIKFGARALLFLGARALPMVIMAVARLGLALLANPIGLAIAVIAGGAYLIYKNWDKLVNWWNNATFEDILLKIPLGPITLAINAFRSLYRWWNGHDLPEKQASISTSDIDTAKSKAGGFLSWWNSLEFKSKSLSVFSRAKEMGAAVAKKWGDGGARATGGPVRAGNFYRVNERGPELLNMHGQSYLMATQAGHISPLISKFNGGLRAANSPAFSAPTLRTVGADSTPKTTVVAQPRSSTNTQKLISQGGDTYNLTVNVDGGDPQAVRRQIEMLFTQLQRRKKMRQNASLHDGTNG